MPAPASATIGTMSRSLLPPRYTSIPRLDRDRQDDDEMHGEEHDLVRRVIGVTVRGCRKMIVDIN